MTLSVVIPALDAARGLGRTIESVGKAADEIVVVDGGSRDGTPDVARAAGARVISAERGRGRQLMVGARHCAGDWLLFLHADTCLDADWPSEAWRFMGDAGNQDRAAAFRFALDSDAGQARLLETMVAWRTRVLGLPYGDQGLLLSRRLYDAVGGYRPLPLMEDVDLVRRLGRRRIVPLSTVALTSAERWLIDGWTSRSLRNFGCLMLYYLGVSPDTINAFYNRDQVGFRRRMHDPSS